MDIIKKEIQTILTHNPKYINYVLTDYVVKKLLNLYKKTYRVKTIKTYRGYIVNFCVNRIIK